MRDGLGLVNLMPIPVLQRGSIGDGGRGGSYAYRASKAALNIGGWTLQW